MAGSSGNSVRTCGGEKIVEVCVSGGLKRCQWRSGALQRACYTCCCLSTCCRADARVEEGKEGKEGKEGRGASP
eukprot:288160-Chlamydomonas_euryale.AAC.2